MLKKDRKKLGVGVSTHSYLFFYFLVRMEKKKQIRIMVYLNPHKFQKENIITKKLLYSIVRKMI